MVLGDDWYGHSFGSSGEASVGACGSDENYLLDIILKMTHSTLQTIVVVVVHLDH